MAMMTSIDPIRVVLAEDHALVRAGIRSLLDGFSEVDVVGEARDGREALRLIDGLRPDVVLIDITMPVFNGLQVVTRVSAEHPTIRSVVLSMHDNEEYVWQALHAGAAGYLLKDSSTQELELAIRAVARGASYLSPSVSRHVVADYVRPETRGRGALARLTPRQQEIVQLIAEGHTNQEIAALLSLSVKTVETHRTQLMERLDLHDVAGIVRFAIRVGLVPPDR